MIKIKVLVKLIDLLKEIDEDMNKFYYGKHPERKLLYLAQLSCMTQKPINTFLTGESSIGKSEMMKATGKYIPKDRYHFFTRISPTSLNRYNANNESWTWNGKILAIAELRGAEQASDVLRVLMSEGESKALITERVGKGKMEAVVWEVSGTPTIVTSTADPHIEHQFATRCFAIELNFTREELKQILIFIARNEATCESVSPDSSLIEKINKLKSYKVEVPYAENIGRFWTNKLARATRDLKSFISLIRTHTLINQNNRELNKKNFLVATEEDYEACREFIPTLYKNSFYGGMTYRDSAYIRSVIELSNEKTYEKIDANGNRIELKGGTIEDVMNKTGTSSNTTSMHLNNLVDAGVLIQYKRYSDGQRQPYIYVPAFQLDENDLPEFSKLVGGR